MASVPKKVAERLIAGLKRFQPILAAAKLVIILVSASLRGSGINVSRYRGTSI